MVWSIVIPVSISKVKANVYNGYGDVVKEIELPPVFGIPIRKDLIRRAFLSAFTARLQPKGRDPLAGKRTTARSWGVGHGIARVPRLPNGRAAFISFARGGHRAFPPRPDRRIHEEINKKEMALAIASALAATANIEFVKARGHVFSVDKLPVVIENSVEDNVVRTKDAKALLQKLGLWEDVERAHERIRIRAGKGKMRGRRYVEPKSILFVISDKDKPIRKAVENLPGVDVVTPKLLSILHLAPGGVPGRLTVFSEKALEEIARKYEVITL
ncbi:50S ribosomal protein L4 [Desulfurococcaceae archaeon MEX13E-LK6-19]|nr:50S ribosomal protein L4 [Desulfurococcaceae archaeon MEX13E-LK6-19]